jgi:UPF0755 protein
MKHKHTGRTILIILLVVIVCVAAVAGYLWYRITRSASYNVDGESEVNLYVYPDDDWHTVGDRIAQRTAVRHGSDLALLGRRGSSPRPGHYLVRPDETTLDLYRTISRGLQTPVRLSFTTTRDVERLWGRLADQLLADSASIARAMTDSVLLDSLGIPGGAIAYYLIPDTYEVYWTEPAEEIVARMARESRAFWSRERLAKAEQVGLTPLEVITLASIINEESAKADEYPVIAGLYLNRLHRGIPLQSDPTVLYAIGDRSIRRVLHKHLRVDSPYNTYLHAGLPPGPIRIPSSSAIDAVLSPREHDYIYRCAKEDFSGYHNFASTYTEHLRNARAYAAALDRRGIH